MTQCRTDGMVAHSGTVRCGEPRGIGRSREKMFMGAGDKETLEVIYRQTIGAGEGIIAALQRLQSEFGYVREDCVDWLARRTGIPAAKFYGVITFYAQFHQTPRGKHIITVCSGTVCHVKGRPASSTGFAAICSFPPTAGRRGICALP